MIKLEIGQTSTGWYIFDETVEKYGEALYLWKDGTWNNSTYNHKENQFNQGYWKTKEEAQQFLDNYERNNMENLNQRLKQAKLDAQKIQENIKDLEKQIEEAKTPKPRHGDVVDHFKDVRYIFRRNGEWISFSDDGVGESNSKRVEQLYKDGGYKVTGNVFDGDKWNG